MLKALHLLICLCVVFQATTFDFKFVTSVRNSIEKNVDYIDRNFEKLNEDCWFGVVLATAMIKDAYQNGSHVMDNSSLRLLKKSLNVLQKGITLPQHRIWVVQYILDPSIWQRNIKYKHNALDQSKKVVPKLKILKNIYYQNLSDDYPNSDICMENIVNSTVSLKPVRCYVRKECWEKFFDYDKEASGYILTHKLLLLQLAKTRKCLISDQEYDLKTKKICMQIFLEVFTADYFDVLDDIFDLFLEEALLCGYEGYTDFIKTKWLMYILKSQRETGCFPPFLGDPLKTRIKRNTNILPDGCADHTTGLGVAVLSLYYNYLIKENTVFVN